MTLKRAALLLAFALLSALRFLVDWALEEVEERLKGKPPEDK